MRHGDGYIGNCRDKKGHNKINRLCPFSVSGHTGSLEVIGGGYFIENVDQGVDHSVLKNL